MKYTSFSSFALSRNAWGIVPFSVACLGGMCTVMLRGTGQGLAASWGHQRAQLTPSAQEEEGLEKEPEEETAPRRMEIGHEPGLVRHKEPQWVCLAQQEGKQEKAVRARRKGANSLGGPSPLVTVNETGSSRWAGSSSAHVPSPSCSSQEGNTGPLPFLSPSRGFKNTASREK